MQQEQLLKEVKDKLKEIKEKLKVIMISLEKKSHRNYNNKTNKTKAEKNKYQTMRKHVELHESGPKREP
eukprot:scaffold193211_cov56-Attheya_sp.AAC.1